MRSGKCRRCRKERSELVTILTSGYRYSKVPGRFARYAMPDVAGNASKQVFAAAAAAPFYGSSRISAVPVSCLASSALLKRFPKRYSYFQLRRVRNGIPSPRISFRKRNLSACYARCLANQKHTRRHRGYGFWDNLSSC